MKKLLLLLCVLFMFSCKEKNLDKNVVNITEEITKESNKETPAAEKPIKEVF